MLTIIIMWLNSQVPSNWWYRTQNQILFPKSMTPSDHKNTINDLRRTWNTSVKCECTLETVVSSCVGVSISMSSACSPVSRVGGSHCVCLQYHGNKHEKNERYIFSYYNRWKVIFSHWEIEKYLICYESVRNIQYTINNRIRDFNPTTKTTTIKIYNNNSI